MSDAGFARVDLKLTRCDREPIHIPGAIQPHGFLLTLRSDDLTILRVSANLPGFLGIDADRLIGRPLAEFVEEGLIGRLVEALRQGDANEINPAVARFLASPQSDFDAILHVGGDETILELEPRSLDLREREAASLATLRGSLARVQAAASLEALCQTTVDEVRRLTGFDRVMIYRFDADWNGQVIAEARNEAVATFLGHHFPAGDIPPQARQLYIHNYVRIIPDAAYEPAAVLGGDDKLDMSPCVLRSVSPVHLEYMRNMGVAASMSLSLVREGQLWALVACHHYAPRYLAYSTRQNCELLGRLVSAQIEAREAADLSRYRDERTALQSKFLEAIASGDHFGDTLTGAAPNLLDYVEAAGVAVLFEDRCAVAGATPDRNALEALRQWLMAGPEAPIFHSHSLPSVYAPAELWKDLACGLLAVEVVREKRGHVLWFRPEVVRTVTWGGDPTRSTTVENGSTRIGPRKSFEAWKQLLQGQSLPWSAREVEAAASLRNVLVSVAMAEVQRLEAQTRLRHEANHDALTGLPNRMLLQRRIEQAIRNATEPEQTLALLLIDLDRFREINDTFGHHYGDLALQQLHPRFRQVLRRADTIARLGGDEFGILLPDADEAGALEVARKLLECLVPPIEVHDQSLEVSGSIGIALFPGHGRDSITLVRRADVARYAAKRAHRGLAVFSPELSPYNPGRLPLISELRRAVERDQLLLHYQPKVDLCTMQPFGAEALIRWSHPREGLMPPDAFIPLAEQTGLIRPLDFWALDAALRQCRDWQGRGMGLNVAVNLAAVSLQDHDLLPTIARILRGAEADPAWLTVEITESAMIEEPSRAMEVLSQIHAMGVRIAIDDFGTGYSSLAYLKDLPVDEVKVDRSFVKNITTNAKTAHIVQSVIELGHGLGLSVIAEGIEDQETADLLTSMGCDGAQGFFFSRPIPPTDFAGWMNSWPDAFTPPA
ncbi:EAL domain-containing protein [Singulisphaera sp. PoT]|uniref:bifunctional diguanylate cyclase/phosphodiesterase n=1 Tax=Singulisphaera sp. PoT TaxID=3411797 RepID=UPI003BF4AF6E